MSHFSQGLGYEIVYFPNTYEPFRQNRNADVQLPDPAELRSDFETTRQPTLWCRWWPRVAPQP